MSLPVTSPETQVRAGEAVSRAFATEIEWAPMVSAEPVEGGERSVEQAERAEPEMVRAKAPNGEAYHCRVVMSTEDVATDGGIVKAAGWKLERFTRNPVLLWAHDYSTAPIGRLVHVEVRGNRLLGWILFDEEDAFAAGIKRKFENGFLFAVSVGFRVLKIRSYWSDDLTDAELKKDARWVADESELLELSAVPVPADSKAVKYTAEVEASRTDGSEAEAPAAEAHPGSEDAGDPAPASADPADEAAPPAPSEDASVEGESEPEAPVAEEEAPQADRSDAIAGLVRAFQIRQLIKSAARL